MRHSISILVLLVFQSAVCLANEKQVTADLLIVGGTESGCAAAIQAARMGVKSIVLVNDIDWLGGQFTAEALVAIDENRGPAGYDHTVPFPRAGLFKELIDRIEKLNKQKYGRARPGNTRVITTCRPADAERVFREMLQPYIESGQIRLFSNFYPSAANVEDDTLKSVTFHGTQDKSKVLVVNARLSIDASDWGDVIKASGAAYEFGPELKSKYHEPLAPTSRDAYPLTDMNPITYCMVIEETDTYKPIPKPLGFDRRSYDNHTYPKDPLWLYPTRRVIDRYNFREVTHPDVLLLCFPAFDYPLDVLPQTVVDALEANEPGSSHKNIVQMSREQRQIVFDNAKQFSLGFLYYLQTVVHDTMKDKTHSFRRFKLSEEFTTSDHLPPKPYIRESLRLRAAYMMRQQDTTGYRNQARNFASAMYHDGIACWQFEYDFHPTGRRFLDKKLGAAGPWTNYFRKGRTWGPPYAGKSLFPLRSLIPEKINGLMGAQKNLGYSSIVSSAVRLHDQCMAIGQACGAVAAVSLRNEATMRTIPYDRTLLSKIWVSLCSRIDGGQPHTLWPFADLAPDHPAFEAANLLAIRGGLPMRGIDVKFEPDKAASDEWKKQVIEKSLATKVIGDPIHPPMKAKTRGEFVRMWWDEIKDLAEKPYERLKPNDADDDGIADRDDALLFNAETSTWKPWKLRPSEDGNPDNLTADKNVRRFNFTGQRSRPVDGFINDTGMPFDSKRGFGWSRDISKSNRRRNQLDGEWRDTFLFTRSHDVWQCLVANGQYTVTVCIGDSGHEQFGQNVTVENQPLFRNQTTALGEFAEKSANIEVRDGKLTIEIGLKGSTTNTCLNWIQFQRQ